MRWNRLYHSIRLAMLHKSSKKAKYVKEHNLLGGMGEKCLWGPTMVPLYPKLIRLHDNVVIHKKAKLMTHDVVNKFLRKARPDLDFGPGERIGCIEIMDNVYVGVDVLIMPDVRINRNCIISAGSVVTGDIPENSVVAGNPAKVIGRFDMYMAMRRMSRSQYVAFPNQELPDELAAEQWVKFDAKHSKADGKAGAEPAGTGKPQ